MHKDFEYLPNHLCTRASDGNGIIFSALKKTFNRAVAHFLKVSTAIVFGTPVVPNKMRLTNNRLYDRGGIIVSTEMIGR